MDDIGAKNIAINGVLEETSEVAGYLWQKGWAERNAGNLSWNLAEVDHAFWKGKAFGPAIKLTSAFINLANQRLLVTGTGTRMRHVWKHPAENTCIIGVEGDGQHYRILAEKNISGDLKPTSELPTHLAIHNMLVASKRSERVVVHTHPNNLIALTHISEFCDESRINSLLWSIQPETCIFVNDGVGFVKYLMTGSDELARATIQKLEKHRVILWEKHGCLAVGNNPGEAFDLIDVLDKSAAIFFSCKNAGYQVEGIGKQHLDKLLKAARISNK